MLSEEILALGPRAVELESGFRVIRRERPFLSIAEILKEVKEQEPRFNSVGYWSCAEEWDAIFKQISAMEAEAAKDMLDRPRPPRADPSEPRNPSSASTPTPNVGPQKSGFGPSAKPGRY
jgi:hypothetical protein